MVQIEVVMTYFQIFFDKEFAPPYLRHARVLQMDSVGLFFSLSFP